MIFRDGVSDSQMDIVAQYEGQQFVSCFNQVKSGAGSPGLGSGSPGSSDLQKKFGALLPKGYNPNFTYIGQVCH